MIADPVAGQLLANEIERQAARINRSRTRLGVNGALVSDLGFYVLEYLPDVLAALRASQSDGAAAMREAAKVACLDLADTYREAGEDHIRNREAVKARQALDWADGAMMCAHAVAKLALAQPDRLPGAATGGETV